jgi:hypothetical protein
MPERMGRSLIHAHNVSGLDNADSRVPVMQQSLELAPDSNQNKTQGFVFFHRIQCSRNHDSGSAITTHGVNSDGDRFHRSSIWHWRVDAGDELLVAGLNYLLATVETVRRHMVTTMHFTGGGVSGQSSSAQGVV